MARDFSAYEKQLAKMQDRDNRRASGGSGDYTWLTTNKPSRVGENTRQKLRIVPRPDGNGGTHDEFWVQIDQHMVKVEGKTRALVCPDNQDDSSSSRLCPLCKLSRELYASREPEYLGLAKELSARVRVFANVVDLEDDNHPDTPKVWGFSRTIHHSILDICMAKRSFIEDLEIGRDVILTTRRIGPQRFDIRYALTDMDSGPIDPAFFDTAKEAHDLETLAKPADLDELHEIAAASDPRSGSKQAAYTPDPTMPASEKPAETKAPAPPSKDDNGESGEWHHSGPDGQVEGLTTEAVVKLVKAASEAAHHVWKNGMNGWEEASEVPEISKLLTPAAPPAPPTKDGPPAPPTPRGGKAF